MNDLDHPTTVTETELWDTLREVACITGLEGRMLNSLTKPQLYAALALIRSRQSDRATAETYKTMAAAVRENPPKPYEGPTPPTRKERAAAKAKEQ